MTMIKQGISFQEQGVVDVLDDTNTCEKCGESINLMESNDGNVGCSSCGHRNKIKDMDSIDE